MIENDLAGIRMRKSNFLLNKPVYTGMTILENSKTLMYDIFHASANFLTDVSADAFPISVEAVF